MGLLGLFAFVAIIMGPLAFFMMWGLRPRVQRLEEQRQRRAFVQADYALKRTNINSRFDYDDASAWDYQQRVRGELATLRNSPAPEPDAPDYSAPKAPAVPNIVAVKRKLSRADIAARRADELQIDSIGSGSEKL